MRLTEGEVIIFGVVWVTSRGRITPLRSSSWSYRLTGFVETVESGTMLGWKSLDKRVGTEGISQSDVKTG